jgi:hypothetical protein
MKRVPDPSVEVLIALRSRWAKRVLTEDGAEIRQVGCWVGLFVIDDDEQGGEPFFTSTRYWRFGDEMHAVMAFDALVAQGVEQ